jgi:hypothetical protein
MTQTKNFLWKKNVLFEFQQIKLCCGHKSRKCKSTCAPFNALSDARFSICSK